MIEFVRKNRLRILSFVICFLAFLMIELLNADKIWMYDSADYWNRGQAIFASGFSLASIDGFRGIIYPLFLGVADLIGGKSFWYVVNALLWTVSISYILPFIVLGKHEYTLGRAVSDISMTILAIALFRGLIIYPLSDFMAFFCIATAAFFLRLSNDSGRLLTKCLFVFFSGAFAYASYNVRTIYMFAAYALAIVFIVMQFRGKRPVKGRIKDMLCALLSAFAGVMLAASPQMAMNLFNLGHASMAVPTDGLMLDQLFWGLASQRFDSLYYPYAQSIGHSDRVSFTDAVGVQMITEAKIFNFSSWGDYFSLLLKHPFDVAALYFRHMINYIFPCWPEMYIENLHSSKWLLGTVGVTVLSLPIVAWLEKCCKKYDGLVYFAPMVIPAILIIPGCVEYRFSFPIYMFAISQLCLNIQWKQLGRCLSRQKVKYLIVYILILAVCFSIWANMLAGEAGSVLFF